MQAIIPTIGSSGYFILRAPFDSLILNGERYTCKAVRKISDYLVNNETPLADIYVANGLTEVQYDEDLKNDVSIVSLQASTGHWVYVPATYITQLPVVNGIAYRSLMLGVSLPPMPADKNLTHVETAVKNVITDLLGVAAGTKFVETSKVVLIDSAKHKTTQAARDAIIAGNTTDRSRLNQALTTIDQLVQKIAVLEQYIEDHQV